MNSILLRIAAALVALLPSVIMSQSRTLDWPSFSVEAELDSTGTLHIREIQTMRLSGDWNGGEREFRVEAGHRFKFKGISRIDSISGSEIVLTEGESSLPDFYHWNDSRTIRWRSRSTNSPSFDNTIITYVLEYSYSNILREVDGVYSLDHEFAFRNRDGEIRNFSLDLNIAPQWRALSELQGSWQLESIAPGESFLVTTDLEWVGEGEPEFVSKSAGSGVRILLSILFSTAVFFILARMLHTEWKAGKFSNGISPRNVDNNWLQQNLFIYKAEVAGALRDEVVGAPEVAATIARMVEEKKLSSRVESKKFLIFSQHILHLNMLIPRNSFFGYERLLIDALFDGSSTSTDTDRIRERYKTIGFNPSPIIENGIESQVRMYKRQKSKDKRSSWLATIAMIFATFSLSIYATFTRGGEGGLTFIILFLVSLAWIYLSIEARLWRKRTMNAGLHFARVIIPVSVLSTFVLVLLISGALHFGTATLIAITVFTFACIRSVVNACKMYHSSEYVSIRRNLAIARKYFQIELSKPEPHLEKSWYPHMLALGLGPHVDRWFRAFGGTTTATRSLGTSESTMTSGLSGVSNDSWSGFGGSGGFSGAGATVAFSAAINTMAAGVSAPSTSSSSGGGSSSSSGGSSGGGGGGGW